MAGRGSVVCSGSGFLGRCEPDCRVGVAGDGRKIPDLLIAAVAEARRLAVLHCDQDFDFIAKATGQRAEWIVPRGTVD